MVSSSLVVKSDRHIVFGNININYMNIYDLFQLFIISRLQVYSN